MTDPDPTPHDGIAPVAGNAIDPATARTRFFLLTALRFAGAFGVVFGLIIHGGQVNWVDPAIRGPVGIAMVVGGGIIMLAVIPVLIRRWRNPPK
jgi:hypothetical protein